MKLSEMLLLGGVSLAAVLSGCSRSDAGERLVNLPPFQPCQEPRPEICYEMYAPVCATLANPQGSPVPAVTYANDCKACADPMVRGFVVGECR